MIALGSLAFVALHSKNQRFSRDCWSRCTRSGSYSIRRKPAAAAPQRGNVFVALLNLFTRSSCDGGQIVVVERVHFHRFFQIFLAAIKSLRCLLRQQHLPSKDFEVVIPKLTLEMAERQKTESPHSP